MRLVVLTTGDGSCVAINPAHIIDIAPDPERPGYCRIYQIDTSTRLVKGGLDELVMMLNRWAFSCR